MIANQTLYDHSRRCSFAEVTRLKLTLQPALSAPPHEHLDLISDLLAVLIIGALTSSVAYKRLLDTIFCRAYHVIDCLRRHVCLDLTRLTSATPHIKWNLLSLYRTDRCWQSQLLRFLLHQLPLC